MKINFGWSVLLGAVALLGVAAAFFWLRSDAPAPLPETPAGREVSPGFAEYRSDMHRFSLLYPAGMSAEEYDETDGAMSMVFEEADAGLGFQIFIVPYAENQITDERFRADVPSGIMRDPIEVMVDGTRATVFWSEDPFLGETREVWFVKNGFLYEITAPAVLDEWLGGIMDSWEFL